MALLVIGTIILIRFALAVAFSWFLSRKLDQMRTKKAVAQSLPTLMPNLKLPSPGRPLPAIVESTLRHSLVWVASRSLPRMLPASPMPGAPIRLSCSW
jgi:hypothetical protein